jgi:hypothetical protein
VAAKSVDASPEPLTTETPPPVLPAAALPALMNTLAPVTEPTPALMLTLPPWVAAESPASTAMDATVVAPRSSATGLLPATMDTDPDEAPLAEPTCRRRFPLEVVAVPVSTWIPPVDTEDVDVVTDTW